MEAAGSTTGAARGKLLSGASTAIIIDARNDAGARSECLFRRLRFKLPDDHISYSMGCHDGCDGRHFNCVPDSSFAENPEHLCAWTVDGKGRRDVGLGAPTIKKLLALCASYAREGVPLSHFERAPRAPPSPGKPVPFEARPLASAGRVEKKSRPKLGASGTGFSVSGGGDRLLLARAKAQQPPVDAAAAVARVKTIAGKAGDASVASAAARRKEQVLERRAEVAEARAAAAEASLAMARRREAALEAKALSLQQRLAAVEVKLAEANMAAWNSANRA